MVFRHQKGCNATGQPPQKGLFYYVQVYSTVALPQTDKQEGEAGKKEVLHYRTAIRDTSGPLPSATPDLSM